MRNFLPTSFVLLCAVLFLLPAAADCQALQHPSIPEILHKADDQRKLYIQEFKNLLSQETRSFELYGKNGEIKKQRIVQSIFIIYQLSKGTGNVSEFRNVVAVDGKPVDNADHRAQDFFEKIEKTESVEKELKKLHDESLRYDIAILVNGFTLFRSVVLDEKLWPCFDYAFDGTETVNGSDAYVVSYKQSKECPYIAVNYKKGAPDIKRSLVYNVDLKDNVDYHERLSGKFVIDPVTFQVWREERTMTLQPEGFDTPVPLAENTFEFQKSDFGIFTPKRITHTQYDFRQKDKTSIKDTRITFEYDKFTKPNVEVKASDVK